jgi:YVTN family beta-propeller protein
MIFRKNILYPVCLLLIAMLFTMAGCMKDDQWVRDHMQQANLNLASGGVFVVNEGNFMYGNATLSFYDTLRKEVQNDLFFRVNGLPLGDVAQSMSIWKSSGYIVVNNSGKIYIIDTTTGKYTGKITGLTSPRYMHFVNSEKAYISDLYAGKITIVNPTSNTVTGVISCPSHPSTEEMVQVGDKLFVTCWSGDKTVLVIDTGKDQVKTEIPTGDQPSGIVKDSYGKIWVLCQASPGSKSGSNPILQRIDPVTEKVDLGLVFSAGTKPVKLTIDGTGNNLWYLSGNEVFKMSVLSRSLPDKPFLSLNTKLLYGLGIDPSNGDIYASDALDYQQPGWILRFDKSGVQKDRFKSGIIPGRFCFK